MGKVDLEFYKKLGKRWKEDFTQGGNTGDAKEDPEEITCWDDLEKIKGWYSANSITQEYDVVRYHNDSDKDVFPTKEMAEASIAMAQLAQLMAHPQYNGANQDDWVTTELLHDGIFGIGKEGGVYCYPWHHVKFLSFKTREKAELFLKNHLDLIEKAKPLL